MSVIFFPAVPCVLSVFRLEFLIWARTTHKSSQQKLEVPDRPTAWFLNGSFHQVHLPEAAVPGDQQKALDLERIQ